MTSPPRFLIVVSETQQARRERRNRVGQSSGETYIDTLLALAPGARCDQVKPADRGAEWPDTAGLAGYDGVFFTGSPLHLYEDTPVVRRVLDFMRAVFSSGTPAFGSCAGLQIATVAAGRRAGRKASGGGVGLPRASSTNPGGGGGPTLARRPSP